MTFSEKLTGNDWLKDAIILYLQTGTGKDSVDIVSHFQLRIDFTLMALQELEVEGRIIRRTIDSIIGGGNSYHLPEPV